jgi:hypothetical protein
VRDKSELSDLLFTKNPVSLPQNKTVQVCRIFFQNFCLTFENKFPAIAVSGLYETEMT